MSSRSETDGVLLVVFATMDIGMVVGQPELGLHHTMVPLVLLETTSRGVVELAEITNSLCSRMY